VNAAIAYMGDRTDTTITTSTNPYGMVVFINVIN
jgi:hypothetical protein